MFNFKVSGNDFNGTRPTWESLEAWKLFFDTEGSRIGVARQLHQQSYQRLLTGCQHRIKADPTTRVIAINVALLLLEKCALDPFVEKKVYSDLQSYIDSGILDAFLPESMYSNFCLIMQDLRLHTNGSIITDICLCFFGFNTEHL